MSVTSQDYVKLYDVGDVLYRVRQKGIDKIIITEVKAYPHYVYRDNLKHSYFNSSITKTCFKTYEEAVEEQKRREHIKEKRKLLKEYEKELNKKFNITNHYIVK